MFLSINDLYLLIYTHLSYFSVHLLLNSYFLISIKGGMEDIDLCDKTTFCAFSCYCNIL